MSNTRPYTPNVPSVTGKYVPERLLDFRFAGNGEKYYLVKWSGFPPEENTWEPRSNLSCFYLMEKIETERTKSEEPGVPEKRQQQPLRRGFLPFEKRITGFDLGRTPEMVLGLCVITGQPEFLVKWEGVREADLIPREIANVRCPQIVINFYEEHLFWKVPEYCCGKKKTPDHCCGKK